MNQPKETTVSRTRARAEYRHSRTRELGSTTFSIVVLFVAALVAGLTIAQAVRQHSWAPIWLIGWLPAILVGAFYRSAIPRRCPGRPPQTKAYRPTR
jgi:hypothetical protein